MNKSALLVLCKNSFTYKSTIKWKEKEEKNTNEKNQTLNSLLDECYTEGILLLNLLINYVRIGNEIK